MSKRGRERRERVRQRERERERMKLHGTRGGGTMGGVGYIARRIRIRLAC